MQRLLLTGLNLAHLDFLNYKDYTKCDCILGTLARPVDLQKENTCPAFFRKITRFSSLTMSLIIACFVAIIEDKRYLSALVVDKGCIKGISDMITAQPFFTEYALASARAQRIYITSQGRVGIILDGDIKSPDCVTNLLRRGASTLFFLTLANYQPLIKRYLDAQTLLNNITIAGTFADKWFIYKEEISLFAIGTTAKGTIFSTASKQNTPKAYTKVFYEF